MSLTNGHAAIECEDGEHSSLFIRKRDRDIESGLKCKKSFYILRKGCFEHFS